MKIVQFLAVSVGLMVGIGSLQAATADEQMKKVRQYMASVIASKTHSTDWKAAELCLLSDKHLGACGDHLEYSLLTNLLSAPQRKILFNEAGEAMEAVFLVSCQESMKSWESDLPLVKQAKIKKLISSLRHSWRLISLARRDFLGLQIKQAQRNCFRQFFNQVMNSSLSHYVKKVWLTNMEEELVFAYDLLDESQKAALRTEVINAKEALDPCDDPSTRDRSRAYAGQINLKIKGITNSMTLDLRKKTFILKEIYESIFHNLPTNIYYSLLIPEDKTVLKQQLGKAITFIFKARIKGSTRFDDYLDLIRMEIDRCNFLENDDRRTLIDLIACHERTSGSARKVPEATARPADDTEDGMDDESRRASRRTAGGEAPPAAYAVPVAAAAGGAGEDPDQKIALPWFKYNNKQYFHKPMTRIEARDKGISVDPKATRNSDEMDIRHKEVAYIILGVPEGATQDHIKTAYRKLARMYHPDKAAALKGPAYILATEQFKYIGAAYDLLK